MNQDFVDLLSTLGRTGSRYHVVGAHALAVHGVPRATGDLGVRVDADPGNLDRVWKALLEFGAPLAALGACPRTQTRMGPDLPSRCTRPRTATYHPVRLRSRAGASRGNLSPPSRERFLDRLLGVSREDLDVPDRVIQIGIPPRRIDILTGVSGLDFDTAWPLRLEHAIGALRVPFLGRDDLIRNKRASGRTKDIADLEALGE